jgi:transcriptional activator HAC1
MITPQPTISIHTLDMEPTMSEPICIKMEDLECLPSADPAVPSLPALPLSPTDAFSPTSADAATSSTPASSTQSQTPEPKAAKKRKSWGQVLPEPKTNLPPRKRAKTEDEKEQRRIERVRRNRLAAHNSRERKRVEVENLLGEKNQLELVVRRLEETVRQQAIYIDRLTSGMGMSSGISAADMAALAGSISVTSNPRAPSPSSDAPSTPMSRTASSGFVGTPTLSSVSSPDSAALPLTPETKPVGESELAQHSAAMLCSPDLQCHSDSPTSTLSSTLSAWTLAISTLLTILSTFPILAPAISLSSRLTARRRTTASRRRQRRSSPTLLPAFLTSPWTTTTSSPTRPRTSKSTLATPSLLCSQAQAQLFQLATGQALLRRATASLFERLDGRLAEAERASRASLDPHRSPVRDGRHRERARRRLAGRGKSLRGRRSTAVVCQPYRADALCMGAVEMGN